MNEITIFCATYKLGYFDRPCLRAMARQIEETVWRFDIEPKSIQLIRDETNYNRPRVYVVLAVITPEHPDSMVDMYQGALDVDIDDEESIGVPDSVIQVATLEEAHQWLSDAITNRYYHHFEVFQSD